MPHCKAPTTTTPDPSPDKELEGASAEVKVVALKFVPPTLVIEVLAGIVIVPALPLLGTLTTTFSTVLSWEVDEVDPFCGTNTPLSIRDDKSEEGKLKELIV